MNNERLDKYRQVSPRRSSAYQPLYYALVLVVGLVIGSYMADRNTLVLGGGGQGNPHKLVSLINFIEENYVDSVDKAKMIDDAIQSVLRNLDPHSYYMSPEELAQAQEELSGGFQGIGVEFLILRDSLMVIRTIPGGPSERAGLQAGDRIVQVNGEPISGKELDSDKAQRLLKGPAGSTVKVGLARKGNASPVQVEIIRGSIPIESVPVAFVVENGIGYLKVERFAKTTYDEFRMEMDRLRNEGTKTIILDFRGNGGGFLDQAVSMVEEFLTPGKVIVYTEGVHDGREVMTSSRDGRYRNMEVVVLIDQGSASASEIVAGALQDWDRSVTVGRRSFGKGLVQREIELSDNSALRLTVARYYTPTGRCIQKPYGDSIDYSDDLHHRLVSGELTDGDKIELPDSLKKVTPGGRVVYGGGGIVPDVFVPLDSNLFSGTLAQLSAIGAIREYTFDYVDRNRKQLAMYTSEDEFIRLFEVTTTMLNELADQAAGSDSELTRTAVMAIAGEVSLRIKAQIARSIFSENAMAKVIARQDAEFAKALEIARNYRKFSVISSVPAR
ncbi:MAG: S41 family peptidase [Flavobacteriales bacterium]|jgi:carboxyl-terminal processing protease